MQAWLRSVEGFGEFEKFKEFKEFKEFKGYQSYSVTVFHCYKGIAGRNSLSRLIGNETTRSLRGGTTKQKSFKWFQGFQVFQVVSWDSE